MYFTKECSLFYREGDIKYSTKDMSCTLKWAYQVFYKEGHVLKKEVPVTYSTKDMPRILQRKACHVFYK